MEFAELREYEAELIPGIEAFVMRELRMKLGKHVSDIHATRAGFLRFRSDAEPALIAGLRSVIAIYRIHRFDIPRPKALLGHQHLTRLIEILRRAGETWQIPHATFGIGAAGADSAVMRRLKHELGQALNLQLAADGKGQLYLRLLRQADKRGWEVLVRTSPQPLSKRAYRLVDVPGALNATVAFAMTQISQLDQGATALNLCSGTSTILIEHGLTQQRDHLLAIDNASHMLIAGWRNAAASQSQAIVQHILADASNVPLPARSVDRIYADLPFGHHIGTHQDNEKLYPAVLREASRLARSQATFVILTHEVQLMHRCLQASPWTAISETRINLRGLHPRIFVLQQNSA